MGGRDGTKRWSALHQAAYSGSLDAVRFLLEHNAALDARTNDGKTALDVAKNSTVKSLMLQFMGDRDVREMPTPLRKRSSATAGSGNGSLKAMKAMTTPKVKKAMKVIQARNIAKGKRSKTLVYKGQFVKTVGGLRKNDLTKNKSGKVVSKKLQTHGMKSYANIKTWVEAFMKARVDLGLVGFVAIKQGSALYSRRWISTSPDVHVTNRQEWHTLCELPV